MNSHFGELAALFTAFLWTASALVMDIATKKVGSLQVNVIRLFIALILLTGYNLIVNGQVFPFHFSGTSLFWLSLSGIIGFALGDLFLFHSYQLMSIRIAMLIMALAPAVAALTGWLFIGEGLSFKSFMGMLITFLGVSIVILERKDKTTYASFNVKLSYPLKGLLFAFGGAVGQGIGLVISKIGMGTQDAFAATQVRVLNGLIGFILLFIILNRWNKLNTAIKDRKSMFLIAIGSVFGPFLGVSFSLLAVKYTTTGIASTIMSIVPVLIIIPAILIHKEKVSVKEIVGALLAVSGVSIFFL